ncbi:MAG TPA: protein kinase, partial [Acidimicrobiales bacterium]
MAAYREVIVGALRGSSLWDVESYSSPASGSWVAVRHRRFRVPDQGWKLHVSSSVARAEETLRRTLPHLLAEPVAFKAASSPDALAALNDGLGAYSQIGKFVTVYPGDDAQAVRLATALADATAGLRGPRIPSDRPLRPGSVVHYRYGSFGSLTLQRANGELVFALRNPSGELVPDVRTASFVPPDWARDPFTHAGVAAELEPERPLVAGRYLVVSPLHLSARGSVLLAVDLDDPRTCVLKQAKGGAAPHLGGGEPGERLQQEAEVLERLRGTAGIPTVASVVSQGEDLYLVMDDLGGRTLESHVLTLNRRGARVPIDRVIGWGRDLARILSSIHSAGFVYRDLKSTNVLVAPDLSLRLVDFELAAALGGTRQAPGFGTRGYVSPQQAGGEPPDVTDDVFALGALLFYLLTGAEPSQAPSPLTLLDRPLRLLNPGVPAALEALVARSLAADADARHSTMAEVDAALEAAASSCVASSSRSPAPALDARSRSLQLARRLADTLCRVAEPAPGGRGLRWVSGHPLTSGLEARDVNAGTAGTVLALAELVSEFADPEHRAVLAAGAVGLA